jgi:Tfp pilus assembly protein PilF
MGDLEQAAIDLKKGIRQALEINPKEYEAHDRLGLTFEKMGQAEQAAGALAKYIELQKDGGDDEDEFT